jgi:hypothetical protein
LSKKPKYLNLQWPNFYDFIEDKNQDLPKENQLLDEFCDRVSDLGFPLSEEGGELLENLDKEVEKRDQDRFDMHIYNDWNGWGISEVLENYVRIVNLGRGRWRVLDERLTLTIVKRLQQGYLQEDG